MPRPKLIARRTVCRRLALDGTELDRLEELQLVIPVRRPGRERAYAPEDIDRLRVYAVLVQELEVNPPGAEIILRLRTRLLTARQRLTQLLLQAREQGVLGELKDLLDALDEDL